jgi:hypothetical protein
MQKNIDRLRISQMVQDEIPFTVKSDVMLYAEIFKCSEKITEQMLNDVKNGFVRGDFSKDYRSVAKQNRLPSNHRRPKTPEKFWNVEFTQKAKMITKEELQYLSNVRD